MLTDALRDYGRIAGFCVATNHNHIRCSRHGERITARNYAGRVLAQDCSLMFYLTALRKVSAPTKPADDGKK